MKWPFLSRKRSLLKPIKTRELVINHNLHTMEITVHIDVTLGDNEHHFVFIPISFIDLDTVSVTIPTDGKYTVVITDGERKHFTRVVDGKVQRNI